ncbi:hypothetical protein [Sulfurimonas sp.]
MIKKILVGGLISLILVANSSANETLKAEMNVLSGILIDMQRGFVTNDKNATLDAVAKLKIEVKNTLGDASDIKKLLPENVKHKASTAVNSAKMINRHISEIEKVLTVKNMRMINRQMRSQKSFLDIQNQCFRCHNIVRDWE